MNDYKEYVIVTNWEEVETDNFYLTDKGWAKNIDKETMERAKKLQAEGHLYYGYVVSAVVFLTYKQMDAGEVFINEDGECIMECEGEVIDNEYEDAFAYSY